jgi:integrase
MSKSSCAPGALAKSVRPPKPYKKYPLYAHPSGRWAKKILGKFHYFAKWGQIRDGQMERLPGDGWREALELYEAQSADLHAGRKPAAHKTKTPTIADLCNEFLAEQERRQSAGEIGRQMFADYKTITDLIVKQFTKDRPINDLRAADFRELRKVMSDRWKSVRLANGITRVKTVFKFAYHIELIDRPIPYLQPRSPIFAKPTDHQLRAEKEAHEQEHGQNMLEADECRKLLDGAPVQLKAMILLGLNCGFGNFDCAKLPLSALDLEKGWVEFPRPKTHVKRRCPLWPETAAALKAAIAERPKPKAEAAELVFVMPSRRPWLSCGIANPISRATRKLMADLGLHRKGLGHYTFRHVFRTVADGAKDQVAANAIMGHVDHSMAAKYRVRVEDERLTAVTDFVRAWLYAKAEGGEA